MIKELLVVDAPQQSCIVNGTFSLRFGDPAFETFELGPFLAKLVEERVFVWLGLHWNSVKCLHSALHFVLETEVSCLSGLKDLIVPTPAVAFFTRAK